MVAPGLPLQPVAETARLRRHPLRERAAQEILNLLAAALGPLTAADLQTLTDRMAGLTTWTLEEALEPLARFVISTSERGYIFAQPKLASTFTRSI
jgi:hypothetical protein